MVYFLSTCEKINAALCQIPIFSAGGKLSFFFSFFGLADPSQSCFFFGSRHCAAALFSQVPKKCIDLDLSLLYILVLGTYSKFVRENAFLAPGVCFPQALLERWPQVCRVKITFTELPMNRFFSTSKNR